MKEITNIIAHLIMDVNLIIVTRASGTQQLIKYIKHALSRAGEHVITHMQIIVQQLIHALQIALNVQVTKELNNMAEMLLCLNFALRLRHQDLNRLMLLQEQQLRGARQIKA